MTKPITLATLAEATEQQVFDQVVAHLRKQGKKALNTDDPSRENACAYRGEGNTACAAGCLMSDEEYSLGMEDVPWDNLVLDGHVPEAHMELITDLQGIHDNQEPSEWEKCWSALACDYMLAYTVE